MRHETPVKIQFANSAQDPDWEEVKPQVKTFGELNLKLTFLETL
jgi:hypothetical protein